MKSNWPVAKAGMVCRCLRPLASECFNHAAPTRSGGGVVSFKRRGAHDPWSDHEIVSVAPEAITFRAGAQLDWALSKSIARLFGPLWADKTVMLTAESIIDWARTSRFCWTRMRANF